MQVPVPQKLTEEQERLLNRSYAYGFVNVTNLEYLSRGFITGRRHRIRVPKEEVPGSWDRCVDPLYDRFMIYTVWKMVLLRMNDPSEVSDDFLIEIAPNGHHLIGYCTLGISIPAHLYEERRKNPMADFAARFPPFSLKREEEGNNNH